MPRLFIAVDLPADRADVLTALRDDQLEARWTPAEQFHITLRFIGDADADRTEGLQERLRAVMAQAFSVSGQGLDVFPSRRKPRVLVARISPTQELIDLQSHIEEIAIEQGFAPDRKSFNPHVTFARLKRASPREVRRFLKAGIDTQIEPFDVDAFHLYRSDLGPDGAEHSIIETYPLASEESS